MVVVHARQRVDGTDAMAIERRHRSLGRGHFHGRWVAFLDV